MTYTKQPVVIYVSYTTFRAPSGLLNSVKRGRLFVRDTIKAIEMRQLGDELAYSVPIQIRKQGGIPDNDEGGVSVLALLSTSDIRIHTWPVPTEGGKVQNEMNGMAYASVNSCRNFDPKKVEALLRRHYLAVQIRTTVSSIRLDR